MSESWAARAFLSRAQRKLFLRGTPIFVFHKIGPAPNGTLDPFDYVRAEVLDRRLADLTAAGLTPSTLEAMAEPTAGNGFIVTFDDGYCNVLENTLAILDRHKVRAIEFIVADRLGGHNDWDTVRGERQERLMDEAQLRDWLGAGHQIGSHSSTHPNLKRLAEAEVREEVLGSKKRLEDRFGIPVCHFSYPSGKFTPRVREIVQEAGYQTACGVEFGVNPPHHSAYELRRIQPLSGRELLAKACHRLKRRLLDSRRSQG